MMCCTGGVAVTVLTAALLLPAPSLAGKERSLTPCFLDGQWRGVGNGGGAAGNGEVTVGVQSQLGPPGSTHTEAYADSQGRRRRRRSVTPLPGFASIPGAAIDCRPGFGCLLDPHGAHGCVEVVGIQSGRQCVWMDGPEVAAAACGPWAGCGGFWCGAAPDISGSNGSWCWARAVDTQLSYKEPFALDTAYVKAPDAPPLPPDQVDLVGAACQSPGCPWTFATGAWFENGTLALTQSDGVVETGLVLSNCDTILWDSGHTWHKLNTNMSTVHIVYMAHLDVGYTTPTVKANLEAYASTFFPSAFNTSRTLRALGGEERFSWTSHPWLLSALLRNQSGSVSPEFVAELEEAIERGDVTWTANPMNMQEECGEVNHMAYGHGLWRELNARFNVSAPKIAASQKDAPGLTLGAVKLFADEGVKLLHIGVNDFSTAPAFPTLSAPYHGYCNKGWLRDSTLKSGQELLLLYCSGYSGPFQLGMQLPNMMTMVSGFDEALVYLMHVDNRGPQTAEDVLAGWKATQRLFPNAKLRVSSMDAWMNALLQARERGDVREDAIPVVVDKEMGSTWIYGLASDPTKMRHYRAVLRAFNEMVAEGAVDPAAADVRLFNNVLLKVPEHTWGYNGAQCNAAPFDNANWRNKSKQCWIGGDTYTSARNSFIDQRDFIRLAIESLDNRTHGHVKGRLYSAIAAREPHDSPSMPPGTWLPFDVLTPVNFKSSSGGASASVMFNRSGAIARLVVDGAVLCDADSGGSHFLGLLLYRTHSEEELNSYGNSYCLRHCASDCGRCAFSKCGLDSSGARSSTNPAAVSAAWRRAVNTTYHEFLFNATFGDPTLESQFGAPPAVLLRVGIDTSKLAKRVVAVDHDLQWFGKMPTKMAESLWFALSPSTGTGTDGWLMDKLGRWVDPMQVATNGSTSMHAVWRGVRKVGPDGSVIVDIESPDAPLISPNLDLLPTGAFGVPARPNQGWSVNLFNNAWNTNYPLWSLDSSERFRFRTTLSAAAAAAAAVANHFSE